MKIACIQTWINKYIGIDDKQTRGSFITLFSGKREILDKFFNYFCTCFQSFDELAGKIND